MEKSGQSSDLLSRVVELESAGDERGDMSAFPTAKHLASWAGVCPGNDESAGKRRSGKTRKGSKWLRANLIEAATAASRTKDTYLQAQYQRLRARRGHARAITALTDSMLVATWHILTTGEVYRDPGGDYFAKRDPERQPNGSSPTSKSSDTPSRSNRQRQPQRQRARSLPEHGVSLQILGHSRSLSILRMTYEVSGDGEAGVRFGACRRWADHRRNSG